MGINTGISWTNATWNPWMGCKEVSPGCAKCYAKREAERFGRDFHTVVRSKTGFTGILSPRTWVKRGTLKPGSMIFTCSISDFFIKEADQYRSEAWDIMRETPYIYLVLTKRPERIQDNLPPDWGTGGYPNVYLGVTIENSQYIDRFSFLHNFPVEKRFISYEPALGPLDVRDLCLYGLVDWVIGGGESDNADPRPMDELAMASVQQTCQAYHVAFFFKQRGGTSRDKNQIWGGDKLRGKRYHEFPAPSFRTQEFIRSFGNEIHP